MFLLYSLTLEILQYTVRSFLEHPIKRKNERIDKMKSNLLII
jgi:hypothetical protein